MTFEHLVGRFWRSVQHDHGGLGQAGQVGQAMGRRGSSKEVLRVGVWCQKGGMGGGGGKGSTAVVHELSLRWCAGSVAERGGKKSKLYFSCYL